MMQFKKKNTPPVESGQATTKKLEGGTRQIDLATVKKGLAALLHRFYGELKSDKTSKAFSFNTLVGVRSGIQRSLLGVRLDPVHIVNDQVSPTKPNNMCKAICRLYEKRRNPSVKSLTSLYSWWVATVEWRKLSEAWYSRSKFEYTYIYARVRIFLTPKIYHAPFLLYRSPKEIPFHAQ